MTYDIAAAEAAQRERMEVLADDRFDVQHAARWRWGAAEAALTAAHTEVRRLREEQDLVLTECRVRGIELEQIRDSYCRAVDTRKAAVAGRQDFRRAYRAARSEIQRLRMLVAAIATAQQLHLGMPSELRDPEAMLAWLRGQAANPWETQAQEDREAIARLRRLLRDVARCPACPHGTQLVDALIHRTTWDAVCAAAKE